jgi:hypothetical protein
MEAVFRPSESTHIQKCGKRERNASSATNKYFAPVRPYRCSLDKLCYAPLPGHTGIIR